MSSKPGIFLEEVWKKVLRDAGGRGLKSCCSGPSKKAQHPQKRLGSCWTRCSGNCLVGHWLSLMLLGVLLVGALAWKRQDSSFQMLGMRHQQEQRRQLSCNAGKSSAKMAAGLQQMVSCWSGAMQKTAGVSQRGRGRAMMVCVIVV